MMPISFVVLAKNEEKNIERCLRSLKPYADEILVLDDKSSDKTCEIARAFGAIIITFENHTDFAAGRNVGMESAKNEWVFFVDADEVLEGEIGELGEIGEISGYRVRRMDVMWGRKIKHGENGLWNKVRLVKKDAGKWTGMVHEIFEAKGEIGQLAEIELMHYPHQTVGEFLGEINNYSEVRAHELFEKGVRGNFWQILFYPLGKFIMDYFFLLGFLDGIQGFVIASLMSFYSFLVRSKLYMLNCDRHTGTGLK